MPKVMVELKGNKYTCWVKKNEDGTELVRLSPNPEWHEEKRGALLLEVEPEEGESVNAAAQKAYCAALGINQVLGKQTWQINLPPKPTPPPKPSVNPPKEAPAPIMVDIDHVEPVVIDDEGNAEPAPPGSYTVRPADPADPMSRESTLFTPPAAALAGAEAAELEDDSEE